jgi:hypothetical protein
MMVLLNPRSRAGRRARAGGSERADARVQEIENDEAAEKQSGLGE